MSVKLAWATSALLAGPLVAVLATAAVAQPSAPTAAATPAAAQGAPARPSLAAGVAAIVNDEVISTYDVNQRASLLLAGAGIEPSRETFERARAQALRDLVDERLQLQEASEKKVTIEPAEVDRAIADIARQNGTSADTLRSQLGASGIGIQTLRAQLESDIAWRRLVGGRYGSRIRISQVQVNDALGRITANISKPQALVSEILLAAETEEDLQQADQIAARLLQEIRNGAPFQNVARQFSSASSAAAGGDLGWLAQGELRPELQGIVDQLQPGQVSRPIRGPGGVYILAVREKRAGVDPATVVRVALRQVTAPKAARQALERAVRRIPGCDGLEPAVASVGGAAVVDLGEASEAELSAEVRDRIREVDEGRASDVYETPDGSLAALVVCARASTGDGVPTRQEVENRLYEQELAMLSQRYLRNLRRDSTIITR
jgi:peptidyl-prolyl cis-trans isomerase SurA